MATGGQAAARPRVLVLGGGFAGIGAARALKKADVEVVLVDRHDYHTFQPLLYQLATGLLEQTAVGHSLRDLVKNQENATIHKAPITAIDLAAKEVSFDGLAPITYDFLVLALGAQVNYFGTGGTPEHAFPMYTLPDADQAQEPHPRTLGSRRQGLGPRRRRRIDGRGRRRRTDRRRDGGGDRRALSRQLRQGLPEPAAGEGAHRPRRGGRGDLRDVQAEPREYARDALEKRTVEVMTGARVQSVSPTRVTLASGEAIAAHTLVWGAGLQGNSLVQSLGIELERGNRIAVGPDLELPGYPGVYVVGDIAAITDSKTEQVLPQLGSVALQSGEHAAETIARTVGGKSTKPFAYRDKGTMAAIGRNAAVVQMLGGKTMKGWKAQAAWRTVHLALLPTNEDRAKAIVDWAGSQLTHQRVGRITVDADE